jgi:hypothetical protein
MERFPAHGRHVLFDATVPPCHEVVMGPGDPDDYPTLELPVVPYDPVMGQTTSSPGELGSW